MGNRTNHIIAGECREDLESALDHLNIAELPCGCLGFSGSLPKWLSQSLERALKTIDAELSERADEHDTSFDDPDSVRELLVRLGNAELTDE